MAIYSPTTFTVRQHLQSDARDVHGRPGRPGRPLSNAPGCMHIRLIAIIQIHFHRPKSPPNLDGQSSKSDVFRAKYLLFSRRFSKRFVLFLFMFFTKVILNQAEGQSLILCYDTNDYWVLV